MVKVLKLAKALAGRGQAWAWGACALFALNGNCWAQDGSRVNTVMLYPGAAVVEREVRVQPGVRVVEFACLPAAIDVQSLQLHGDAGIKFGALDVQSVDRLTAPACARTAGDERIRALEDQRAVVEAEHDADEVVLNFLKAPPVNGGVTGSGIQNSPRSAQGDAQALDAMRRYAHDAYAREYRQRRKMDDIDRELAPLRAERDRIAAKDMRWRMVRATVSVEHAGTARLAYRVSGAGWTPAYRASLDTSAASLALERLAKIAQRTGEDWTGVRLTLSTVVPNGAPSGPTPQPWRLDIAPDNSMRSMPPMPAPAPVAAMAMRAKSPAGEPDEPLLDVTWANEAYATAFSVPGVVDLKSNGQDITLSLARDTVPVQLTTRTAPGIDPNAYLIAQAPRQSGAWPAGMVQLMRDGAYVGSVRFAQTDDALILPYGRDEQVLVSTESVRDFKATTGLLDKRGERQLGWVYTIRNSHTWPIHLQVLADTPVSGNEAIQVKSTLTPNPDITDWDKRTGVVGWTATLPAGASARYQADYLISYPKDARVSGLR